MNKTYRQACAIERPIMGLSDEYPAGYLDAWHQHQHAQLLFGLSGVMLVTTDSNSYILPPRRALFLPPNTPHEVRCRNRVSLRTLYLSPELLLPGLCKVIDVSDLLRALIAEMVRCSERRVYGQREEKITQLLLDELCQTSALSSQVLMPQDARLRRVCQMLLSNAADSRSLDDWANVAALSRRSFTRLFRLETGTSFEQWKREVRLLEAVALLSAGNSVTETALAVGYDNLSAFTAMFRRTMGVPPTHFIQGKLNPTKVSLE